MTEPARDQGSPEALAPEGAPATSGVRVDVWLAALEAPGIDCERLAQLLPEEERRRAGRIRSAGVRRRFLTSKATMRQVLAGYAGIRPRDLEIALGEHGKPYLARHDIFFNLSHSGSLVVLAVSRTHSVGIDIELARAPLVSDQMILRCCSLRERQLLRRSVGSDRSRLFSTFWTRKEALLKAAGMGICDHLNRIDSADLLEGYSIDRRLIAEWPDLARPWMMVPLPLSSPVQATLAVEGVRPVEVAFRRASASSTPPDYEFPQLLRTRIVHVVDLPTAADEYV